VFLFPSAEEKIETKANEVDVTDIRQTATHASDAALRMQVVQGLGLEFRV
jgi:hypothetical protein